MSVGRAFPHRSMESIKGLRKSINYKSLVARLAAQEEDRPPAEAPESPVRYEHGEGTERRWTTPEPKDRRGPKVRWSWDLLFNVARWEVRLSLVGCPDINVRLSELFPERTLDAIKDMRRLPKFRAIVETFLESEELQGTLPEMDRSPPEPVSVNESETDEVRGPGVGGLARHSLSLRLTLDDDETEVVEETQDVVQLVPPRGWFSRECRGVAGDAPDDPTGQRSGPPDSAI